MPAGLDTAYNESFWRLCRPRSAVAGGSAILIHDSFWWYRPIRRKRPIQHRGQSDTSTLELLIHHRPRSVEICLIDLRRVAIGADVFVNHVHRNVVRLVRP